LPGRKGFNALLLAQTVSLSRQATNLEEKKESAKKRNCSLSTSLEDPTHRGSEGKGGKEEGPSPQ